MRRRLEFYARDPDLVVRGPLPWETAVITLNHLGVGAWTVDLPATSRVLERVAAGWGVVAVLDGTQVMSGSVEDPERERVSAGMGTVSVTGGDDLAIIAGALAWPDPTQPVATQGFAYDARSGAAETVLKGYVAANIGVGRAANRADAAAPAAREVVVAADLARGDTVEYRARFDPLMDVVRACHGGLGVTCQQDGGDVVFDVFVPTDQPGAVFSFELGNLTRVRWRDAIPEATHVIVGGDGDGEDRAFRMRSDSAAAQSWRMAVEEFVDQRNETTTAALDQAGDSALADGRRSGIIEATLMDTARVRFGDDYALGDRVTISPSPGVAYTDVITSVRIDANRRDGTVAIAPSVGWADSLYQTRQDREIAQLRRAVSALERSQ